MPHRKALIAASLANTTPSGSPDGVVFASSLLKYSGGQLAEAFFRLS
jgi:hypothetical protein